MIIKLDCREIKLHEVCLAAIAADTVVDNV